MRCVALARSLSCDRYIHICTILSLSCCRCCICVCVRMSDRSACWCALRNLKKVALKPLTSAARSPPEFVFGNYKSPAALCPLPHPPPPSHSTHNKPLCQGGRQIESSHLPQKKKNFLGGAGLQTANTCEEKSLVVVVVAVVVVLLVRCLCDREWH